MERSSVFHKSEQPYAYAVANDRLVVRLRTRAGDCDHVFAHYRNLYDHTSPYRKAEMAPVLSDGVVTLYEGELHVPERHFKYWFELIRGAESLCYTSDGFLDGVSERNCFYFPAINADDIVAPPAWAGGGMVYQIFVDRFSGGKPEPETPSRFCGGDLPGAAARLDYVKSLGAEMVYLSPVWQSPTYHKYDVSDYYAVDAALGGDEALLAFVEKAHSLGLKVILDAVFNHCSDQNPLFQDVLLRGEASPYRDWFYPGGFPVTSDPCNYDTFAGAVPSMPRFNTSNPEVIEYLTDAALYWTKRLNLDGWRLDVADEVSHSLWRELRLKLKAFNPDVLIIGEVWNHAGAWLRGDEFDTVTNYKLRSALLSFAGGHTDSAAFWQAVVANRMRYMTPFYPYLLSFAGTHDTIRARTALGDERLFLLTLAAVLTMDGIPLLYYGDEVGMEGGEDPDNRRRMRWDLTDSPLAHEIRTLSNFRAQSPALRFGSMEPVPAGDRVLAFVRAYGGEKRLVVLNFGRTDAFLPGTFEKVLLGDAAIVKNGRKNNVSETGDFERNSFEKVCEESGLRVPAMRYAVVG